MKRVVMILMMYLLCLSALAHAGNGDFTVSGSIGVGTTSPAATAALDVTSTTKGFLPPRMTTLQRNAIVSPATGLLIYNTNENSYNYYTGTGWLSIGTIQGTYNNTGFQIFTTSGTFTVPAGITKVYVEAWGGGGGGGASADSGGAYNGSNGGTTSFGTFLTVTGGGGGLSGYSNGIGGAGGLGNSLGLNGTVGGTGTMGGYGGEGGPDIINMGGGGGTSFVLGAGVGMGGNGGGNDYSSRAGGGGGGGGFARTFISVTPGQQVAVTIGAGGVKGSTYGNQTAGAPGKLIVYW